MRTFTVVAVTVALAACAGAPDPERVTSTLDCRPLGSGTAVPCTLTLQEPARFRLTVVSVDCIARETVVTITSPAAVAGDVLTNACSASAGETFDFEDNGAPFPAGTVIDMVFTSDQFASPPGIRVTGSFASGWQVNFEDGFDTDFNDLILAVTALPASS